MCPASSKTKTSFAPEDLGFVAVVEAAGAVAELLADELVVADCELAEPAVVPAEPVLLDEPEPDAPVPDEAAPVAALLDAAPLLAAE